MLIPFAHRRRLAAWMPVVLLLLFALLTLSFMSENEPIGNWVPSSSKTPSSTGPGQTSSEDDEQPEATELSVPEIEEAAAAGLRRPPESAFCRSRFGTEHLTAIRDRGPIQYCASPGSTTAELSCFHGHNADVDGKVGADRVDTMCLARGAVLDASRRAFVLGCDVRRPDENETARGLIPFERLHAFWYETGPKALFKSFVRLESPSSGSAAALAKRAPEPDESEGEEKDYSPPRFTLLVKREPMINLWHNLMEIMVMTKTIDVLRMSRDFSLKTTPPFFRVPEDVADTQVLILDDAPEGPFWDLWRIFAGRPPLRLKDVLADPDKAARFASAPHNLIVPFPGGSNPLWQNDWVVRDCEDAPLVRVFSRRVLDYYGLGVPPVDEEAESPVINVTFVDRRGSRKLVGAGGLVEALRAKYTDGSIAVRLVDFADLSFAEQLRIAQETDVLVGGHGAGLTHAMFMREGRGAVVEVQPASLSHKGFRNLAVMMGHRYFGAHAEEVVSVPEGADPAEVRSVGEKSNWQEHDIRIEKERFLELMDVAIKSLYNEGMRNHDAV